MNEFDIYTIGSGFFLEKIFNAIRLVLGGQGNFTTIMKFSTLIAIVIIAVRGGINNDFKSAIRWFTSVTILVGLFLTGKATVHIHDTLPDSYGFMSAPRPVEDVPFGLAFIGSATSKVGYFVASKFDSSFSGAFGNEDYQKTGVVFGSKIVEDVSKLRISDSNLQAYISKFYKKCIVPDLNTGYNRTNGYTIKDLADSEDILTFLKDRTSKARTISRPVQNKTQKEDKDDKENKEDKTPKDYISCNAAAGHIATSLELEATKRQPILAKGFLSYFFPNNQAFNSNDVFEKILSSSYGIFLTKKSTNGNQAIVQESRSAKSILLQNMMINALGDKVDSINKSYGRATTEAMTKSAFYSVSQMAQKFVPILRAVLECLFYGVFPLILILMVTPIGMEVLKNYVMGFVYLQLWQPMYAILFCIASTWGKYYASDIGSITYATHAKIAHINDEISAVAGYMLTMVPILSVFITKGMVSGMGNLSSSIMYIPQTAAVGNAESAVKGNYQLGTTSIDTHSFNTTTGNKYDDNHSWMSGMKSFSMASGAHERTMSDGRTSIDSTGAVSNIAGLAKVDWSKAIGSRYDKSISDQISMAERHSSSAIESASSGFSKLLGYDQNFSKGSNEYQSWTKGLNNEQRSSIDEARSYIDKVAKENSMNQQDAISLAVSSNIGIGGDKKGLLSKIVGRLGVDGSTSATKSENYNHALSSTSDKRFAENLSKIENLANSNAFQESNSVNHSILEGARSDFGKSKSASTEASKSMDKVHSLQESRSAFEQNSGSISQDLSNKFAEQNIKKYGASGFENIIRNNPEETNKLLNNFLNENPITENRVISNEFNKQKETFNNHSINPIQNQNVKNVTSMNENHDSNKTRVMKETPPVLKETILSNLSHKSNIKQIDENANINKIDKSAKAIEEKNELMQSKVLEQKDQSATRTLYNSWVKPKIAKD